MIDFGVIAAAVRGAQQLDSAVALIARQVGRLRSRPDEAARKLIEVLDEIDRTYVAVTSGINQYLALGVPGDGVVLRAESVLALQTGMVDAVERGRGHCHRIGAIYRRHLDTWFEQVLDKVEYVAIKDVFDSLQTADGDAFQLLTTIARVLQQEADEVVDLIFDGRSQEARAQIRAAYDALKQLRRDLREDRLRLTLLRNEFLQMVDYA